MIKNWIESFKLIQDEIKNILKQYYEKCIINESKLGFSRTINIFSPDFIKFYPEMIQNKLKNKTVYCNIVPLLDVPTDTFFDKEGSYNHFSFQDAKRLQKNEKEEIKKILCLDLSLNAMNMIYKNVWIPIIADFITDSNWKFINFNRIYNEDKITVHSFSMEVIYTLPYF